MTVRCLAQTDIPRLQSMLSRPETVEQLGFTPSVDDVRRHLWGDPDFQPAYALGAGDPLKAFVVGVRRPWKTGRETVGFIKWLHVDDETGGRMAADLLDACTSAMVADGVDRLEYGACAPCYLVPGVGVGDRELARVLRDAGWSASSDRLSLTAAIPEMVEKPALSDGYRLRRADPGDVESATAFIEREFGPSWAREAAPSFVASSPAFCSLGLYGDRICGFAVVHAGNPNWLGPMGVDSEDRGRGIGRALLNHVLLEAGRRGTDRLLLSWVNDKEGFYRCLLPGAGVLRFRTFTREAPARTS